MNRDEILNMSAMPAPNPSYPRGPYRFFNREYLILTYESDPDAIRRILPEPLEPDGSNQVFYEWIKMPDSTGFGSYEESGQVIPCLFEGQPVNYTAMMFLNDEPPITAGREIWGFPKRWSEPRLEVRNRDTLVGTLTDGGQLVAQGTMPYKWHDTLDPDPAKAAAKLSKTQVNLKFIPCVTGGVRIAELIAYEMTDIQVKFHYSGPARLHLVPHVSAPVADLPVRRMVGAQHFRADASLPYGRIIHDYLAE